MQLICTRICVKIKYSIGSAGEMQTLHFARGVIIQLDTLNAESSAIGQNASRTGWCYHPAAAQLRSRPRWNSRRSTARGALSRHKFVIASAASSRKLPNTPRDHPQTHDTLSERLAQTNVFQPSRRESLLLVERPLDPVRSCLF